MPLYDFECEKCSTTIEEFVKVQVKNRIEDTKDYPKCPQCGATMKRLPPRSNFVLKGRGWAKDGYS